jgi:surfeit locus 1 family protein
MFKNMFSRRWLATTLLVIAALAVMIRMGVWQLDRLEASQAFDAHLIAMQKAPMLVLDEAAISQDLTSMEYRQVMASGIFDYEHQVALRNQYWGDPDGTAEYGFHLLTPLVLETSQAVLVDRGWIPGEYDTPESWRLFDGLSGGEVTGIIRFPIQKGEMGGGVPNPAPIPGQPLSFWNYIDLERIQNQCPYPLLPIYIEQAPMADLTALPYRSLPPLDLNDVPHLGYALMWLFFACLLFFGYPVYLCRRIIS